MREQPFLTAALLCERVLEEKDGTLSVVRIADRVTMTYPKEGLPEGQKPVIQITALIALKSGPVSGQFTLKFTPISPSGREMNSFALQIKLDGNDRGVNQVINMVLGVEEEGLYWFRVDFEDGLLTKIPLMVIRQQHGGELATQ